MMTQRKYLPCFYLFLHFITTNVNARTLSFKNDKLSVQQNDKETSVPLSFSPFLTNSQNGKRDATSSDNDGVLIDSELSQIFQRSANGGKVEGFQENQRRCKKNPITRHHRLRRYILHGSKIMKYDVKWTIITPSKKLPFSQQKTVLEKAFRTWAAKCRLAFSYTTNISQADIPIKFVTGDHGDVEHFDDAGAIKAHGFFPSYGSEIHFDDYETWVSDPNGVGGISLLTVAIHEIGHSLGLRHSSKTTAVMYPVLHQGKNTLDIDDISGIRAIYGDCTVQNVDAVLTRNNGFQDIAMVFKNEWVWEVELSTKTIKHGFPQKISKYFNGALSGKQPFKSVFYERKYKTFVFMFQNGFTILDDYPGYPAQMKDVPYNSHMSFFTFLKQQPDVAFVDPHNPDIYHFFIGTQYYLYSMNTFKLEKQSKIQDVWPGLPNNLNTAFYNFEKKAYYFIKDNEYFTLDSVSGAYYPSGVLTDIFQNICPI